MSEELNQFLRHYIPGEDLAPFIASFRPVSTSKGQHLLKPGMDCSFLAFIEHGTFRVYHHDRGGREIVTWFSFRGMMITDLLGFYTTGRASFYVEALEDSRLLNISKDALDRVYAMHPSYRRFGQRFAEGALTMLMQRTMSLHTKSAEERYLELLEHPEMMQKVPLKHMASFLGITDTSLSRIRSKLAKK